MSMYVPKNKKAKRSCVFYGANKRRDDGSANCRLTTYHVCDPDTCAWYKNEQQMAASFEKARQNYIKRYGKDDYYKLGYGPKNWAGTRFKNDEEETANEGKD